MFCEELRKEVGSSYNKDNKGETEQSEMAAAVVEENVEQCDCSHFRFIGTIEVSHLKISEYISEKTGLRIFLGNVNSSTVNGYFTVSTEAHDNEGLPHTLEHLIFMGSKKYPYKGFLDKFASRCLSEGTNAWTAVDHTTYTIATAGVEGFLNVLPVYIDHILYPTLEDSAFISEVHHVTPEGTNSGVVYSEMQSSENSAYSIIMRELLKQLYPGDSGYSYETGGILADLRKTNNEKVRAYHKKFYRWNNLSIIITGAFNNDEILKNVACIEKKYFDCMTELEKEELFKTNFKPWTDPRNFVELKESSVSTVKFPSDDEDSGRVIIAWRGADWSDFVLRISIDIIGIYLTDSNISPLEKLFVEIEDPLCSNVSFLSENYKCTYFAIDFEDVPYSRNKEDFKKEISNEKYRDEEDLNLRENKVDQISSELRKVLQKVYDEGIDIQRIRTLLNRELCQSLYYMQLSPHSSVSQTVNEYLVNGNDFNQLKEILQLEKNFESLVKHDSEYWKNILKRFFIDAPYVEVRCIPCKEKAKDLQVEEIHLQKSQIKELGEEKLKEIKSMLQMIKERQNAIIPNELLENIKPIDINKIKLLDYPVVNNFEAFSAKDAGGYLYQNRQNCASEDYLKKENLIPKKEKNPTNVDKKSALESHMKRVKKDGECVEYNCNLTVHTFFERLNNLPFLFQFDSIPSDFVKVRLMFRIPESFNNYQKSAMLLLSQLFFECPLGGDESTQICVNKSCYSIDEATGETYMSHETVTQKLLDYTAEYSASIGFGGALFKVGAYPDFLNICFACIAKKYNDALCLVLDHCLNINITKDRFLVQLKILKNSITEKKRKATFLLNQIQNGMRYKQDCIINQCNLSNQEKLLNHLYFASKNKPCNKNGKCGLSGKAIEKCTLAANNSTKSRGLEANEPCIKIEELLQDLQNICNEIFQTKNLIVHVSGDLSKLDEKWVEPWESFGRILLEKQKKFNFSSHLSAGHSSSVTSSSSSGVYNNGSFLLNSEQEKKAHFSTVQKLLRIKQDHENCISSNDVTCVGNSVLCGLASTDASHLLMSAKVCEGYEHEDLPALMVLAEYFGMMDGPLFKEIRGGGHAYGCGLRYSPSTGQLTLYISPATEICEALNIAIGIFKRYCGVEECSKRKAEGGSVDDVKEEDECRERSSSTNGVNPGKNSNSHLGGFRDSANSNLNDLPCTYDINDLKSAKSATLFSIIEKENTISEYAFQKILNVFKNVSYDYNKTLLNKIKNLQIEDIARVSHKYLLQLCSFKFDSFSLKDGKSLCIVANSKKLDSISIFVQSCGIIDNIRIIKPKIFFKCLHLQTHLEDIQTEEDDVDDEEDEDYEDDESINGEVTDQ